MTCMQDCGVQLTDEPDKRCYPLADSLLCHGCHVQRLRLDPNQISKVMTQNGPPSDSSGTGSQLGTPPPSIIGTPNHMSGTSTPQHQPMVNMPSAVSATVHKSTLNSSPYRMTSTNNMDNHAHSGSPASANYHITDL